MSRILLLGGTGAIGSHLAPKLSALGYEVYVTSRRSAGRSISQVHRLVGDAKDKAFLCRALVETRPEAIVDFMNYGTVEFMNRRDILLSSTGHYLFLSSCRVFAGEEIHTERSPRLLDVCDEADYLKTDEYALAKARQENLLRESGRSNWTIIRPCITYSAPRFQFGCLESGTFIVRALQGLPSVIPNGMLDKRTSMMWGGDVAEMISRLVCRNEALGEDFNAVTAENHTWREIGEIYNKVIGLKYKTCSVPEYSRICNSYQVKYGRMVDHMFDNTKILAVTGMRQDDLRTLPVGIEMEIVRLRDIGPLMPDIERIAEIDRIMSTRFRVDGGWRKRMEYECARRPEIGRWMRFLKRLRHII